MNNERAFGTFISDGFSLLVRSAVCCDYASFVIVSFVVCPVEFGLLFFFFLRLLDETFECFCTRIEKVWILSLTLYRTTKLLLLGLRMGEKRLRCAELLLGLDDFLFV